MKKRAATARAFTLVEILIVVVILGILAAIAVPKLSNAAHAARESTLKEDLRFLRTQIAVFNSQHRDTFPGYPGGDTTATPSETLFVDQLTLHTDENCNPSATASATFKFGPYLSRMPENPVSSFVTITIVDPAGTFTADGTTGWLYQPSTGRIQANMVGADSDGKPFANY